MEVSLATAHAALSREMMIVGVDAPESDTSGSRARPRLLLISGSLRAGSSNALVLDRAAAVSAALFEADFYDDLAALPAFNPDIEELGEAHPRFPASARALRERVANAGALLISTPEYAHGLPGALKNALDWLVGSLTFPGIPFGMINVAAHSQFAAVQLLEIVRTMSANVIADACITLDKNATPLGRTLEEMHPDAARALGDAMAALHASARLVPRNP